MKGIILLSKSMCIYEFEGNVLDLMEAMFDISEECIYTDKENTSLVLVYYEDIIDYMKSSNSLERLDNLCDQHDISLLVMCGHKLTNLAFWYPLGYYQYFPRFRKLWNAFMIYRSSDIYSIQYELISKITGSAAALDEIRMSEKDLRSFESLEDFFSYLKSADVITV